MKALGIVRRIDDLGRIVIPDEVRRANSWEPGTAVEMLATEEGIFIREYATHDKSELIQQLEDASRLVGNETVKLAIEKAKQYISKK